MESHGSNPVLEPTDKDIDLVLSEYACKKCFGRGYIGWTLNNDPVMCDCVERARQKLKELKIIPRDNLEGPVEL